VTQNLAHETGVGANEEGQDVLLAERFVGHGIIVINGAYGKRMVVKKRQRRKTVGDMLP